MLKNAMIGLSLLDQRIYNHMPITIDILKVIVQVLPSLCRLSYETTLFTAIFVTTFYGYFGIGELVFRIQILILVILSSCRIFHSVLIMQVISHKSKAFQDRPGREGCCKVVNINSVGKHVCPVLSLHKFLNLRK